MRQKYLNDYCTKDLKIRYKGEKLLCGYNILYFFVFLLDPNARSTLV